MPQRRMFSPNVIASDAFLDMAVAARELYFELGIYADDDGFIGPKKIMRMIRASEDTNLESIWGILPPSLTMTSSSRRKSIISTKRI